VIGLGLSRAHGRSVNLALTFGIKLQLSIPASLYRIYILLRGR
jgi:hypothetical protein